MCGSSDEKDAELYVGLHGSWDATGSVLGEHITCLCLFPFSFVKQENVGLCCSKRIHEPEEGLLYSRMATIKTQSPRKCPQGPG